MTAQAVESEAQGLPPIHLWLRAESIAEETRTPLLPADAGQLVAAGFRVTVERSPWRMFSIVEYASVGCEIAAEGSWPEAPHEAYIIGLRDLPDDDHPLVHRHMFFARIFKRQPGSDSLLRRFHAGGGSAISYAYLVDDAGRRLIPSNYYGGFLGAALAVWQWTRAARGDTLPALAPFDSEAFLLRELRDSLARARAAPRLAIVGHHGGAGRGAIALADRLSLRFQGWGKEETAGGGPFPEFLASDVLVNCIGTHRPISPLLDHALLARPDRRLRVIGDVTCDVGNPFNALPWVDGLTSFDQPARRYFDQPPLDVIGLGRLSALLPREFCQSFSSALRPLLAELPAPRRPWRRALMLFWQKMQTEFGDTRRTAVRRRA